MSTDSDVEVDGDVGGGEEQKVGEPSVDALRAWDDTKLFLRPLGRRFASPENLAKKVDAALAKKKEPVAPKFDAATAAPSEATRAASRAIHIVHTVLARSSGARTTAAPLRALDPGPVARCEQLRQDEADAQVVARADRAAEVARKAHAVIAAINAHSHSNAYGDGSCNDMHGGPDAKQLRDPPETVAAAVPDTPVRALFLLSQSPFIPAPSPTAGPWWQHKTVAQLVGWYGLDHEGSDRARFRRHVGVIVRKCDSVNEAQRAENLLLARKLTTSLAWERGRLALLDKLQEL